MTELSDQTGQIEKYSLYGFEPLELENFSEVEEILLKLASRLRKSGACYDISWRGAKTPFRLRSETPVSENTTEISRVTSRGGRITLRISGISETVKKALVQELELLFHLPAGPFQERQEKDLNLLFPGAFEAEVKIEFSRWHEYELPFWLLRLELSEQLQWRRVTKTLKHASSLRDKICKVTDQLLLILFRARSYEERLDTELNTRLNRQHSAQKFKLLSLHVPESCEDWNEIKNFMR